MTSSAATAPAASPSAATNTTAAAAATRRRRDSSDDFGAAASLGSIGGSEVGSSVASESHAAGEATVLSVHSAANTSQVKPLATPLSCSTPKAVDTTASNTTPNSNLRKEQPTSAPEPIPASQRKQPPPTQETEVEVDGDGDGDQPVTDTTAAAVAVAAAPPAPPPVAQVLTTPTKLFPASPTTLATHNEATPQVKNTSSEKRPMQRPALKSSSSPTLSRRPFRKRNCSVDFTLDVEPKSSHHHYHQQQQQQQKHRREEGPPTTVKLPTPNSSALATPHASPPPAAAATVDALPSVDKLPFDHPEGNGESQAAHHSSQKSRSDSLHTSSSNSNNTTSHNWLRFRADTMDTTLTMSSAAAVAENNRPRADTLERLDMLGIEAQLAASKIPDPKPIRSRKDSIESQYSFTSTSHRMLLEAFMGGDMTDRSHLHMDDEEMDDEEDDDDDEQDDDEEDDIDREYDQAAYRNRSGDDDGDDQESLVDSRAAEEAEEHELARETRLGSFDVIRDRLGSFDVRERLGSFDVRERLGSFDATLNSSHEHARRRDRLESWGGMSDLSIPVHDSSANDSLIGGTTNNQATSTAALAAAMYTSLANDLTAIANADGSESVSSFLINDEKIPSKIHANRDRLNSINSAATDLSFSAAIMPSPDDTIPSDIQKYVKAAMASVGDQLAGFSTTDNFSAATKDLEDHSELSSTASPIIGAMSDAASKQGSWVHIEQRARSSSLAGALDIAVDYDAVAAAVNAAEAAAGAIDLAAFAHSASASVTSTASSSKISNKRKRHQLPIKKSAAAKKTKAAPPPKRSAPPIELPPIPKSKMDERDLELIRERARAAAGYVPPSKLNPGQKPPMPPKKRAKLGPQTPNFKPSAAYTTPRSNNSAKSSVASTPYTPAYTSTPGSAKSSASKGQSSQKWDSMFDCLLKFIEESRQEETKGMSDEEKKAWVWDGNVPTTFKTKDGKALGRWVNNQRSAKSKGSLKEDREKRLVDAGLKWSVLASNSWNEMLEELRLYVNEYTKSGRKWDGNVPTNYRIKTKPGAAATKDDEDKNLGRWVNRQRSLYQAGKLRKDRQLALEKVGLKWSMLATTSWESMFETLVEYVEQKTKDGSEWDGNVPANYRTPDNPPRALGRWINRQRSAYGKDKMKPECVEKLNKVGLKWAVHERRPGSNGDGPMTPGNVASTPSSVVSSSLSLPVQNSNGYHQASPLKPDAVSSSLSRKDKKRDEDKSVGSPTRADKTAQVVAAKKDDGEGKKSTETTVSSENMVPTSASQKCKEAEKNTAELSEAQIAKAITSTVHSSKDEEEKKDAEVSAVAKRDAPPPDVRSDEEEKKQPAEVAAAAVIKKVSSSADDRSDEAENNPPVAIRTVESKTLRQATDDDKRDDRNAGVVISGTELKTSGGDESKAPCSVTEATVNEKPTSPSAGHKPE